MPTGSQPSVAILGIGQMGLVCAGVLASAPWNSATGQSRCRKVAIWGHNEDEAGQLAQTRRSPRLSGFILPDHVHVCYRDADPLRDADLIVSAIPVQYIRGAWQRLAPLINPRAAIVSVAKGIENDTLLRPTQVIQDTLRSVGRDDPDKPARPMACLSGPTIATELARCLPAAMIAASDDAGFALQIQSLFATSWLRVYTNPDILGVELAGATKNVIAIAAGIVDGLQAGNNAKSALLARGLAEIARLGLAMGASPETFFGIAGLGDLATSCFSPEGRNRSCGEHLGRGGSLEEYLAATPYVVEGVATARSVVDLARKYRVEMPLTQAVHSVLFEGLDPIEAIGQLMSREQKAERVG
ncbi:MAG: NAD(P)-dependent glycerol-3-phosphate dehydrogenase [Phycisphaerales bacterium]|nr:NAD(P)-dependent glycerol-3-phosphate dehydrogenase [Phycisphaerales bacterium]